jgi:hypothetical protein
MAASPPYNQAAGTEQPNSQGSQSPWQEEDLELTSHHPEDPPIVQTSIWRSGTLFHSPPFISTRSASDLSTPPVAGYAFRIPEALDTLSDDAWLRGRTAVTRGQRHRSAVLKEGGRGVT